MLEQMLRESAGRPRGDVNRIFDTAFEDWCQGPVTSSARIQARTTRDPATFLRAANLRLAQQRHRINLWVCKR